MEEIKIETTYNCYSDEEIKEAKDKLQEYVDESEKNGGFLYVKFHTTQKKGSIAKLVFDEPLVINSSYYGNNRTYVRLDNTNGTLKWDGRKNKPKSYLSNNTLIWLKGYEGNTKWVSVDAKAEKEKALKNEIQRDIDGKELKVGDSVVYINARYGSGMVLCFGV